MKQRCSWVNLRNKLYIQYHDEEWGVSVHDDRVLFEFLVLEGAQAGLSWETILKRREEYRKAFYGFDVEKILEKLDERRMEELMQDEGIIRNKLKIQSVLKNAKVFRQIQQEFGSFDSYLWGYVDRMSVKGNYKECSEIPATTDLSDKISKDLKKRGMSFVGSTIIYAYLQAVGVVNDHEINCFRY